MKFYICVYTYIRNGKVTLSIYYEFTTKLQNFVENWDKNWTEGQKISCVFKTLSRTVVTYIYMSEYAYTNCETWHPSGCFSICHLALHQPISGPATGVQVW